MVRLRKWMPAWLATAGLLLAACSAGTTARAAGKPRVVVSSNLIGDVVRQVAGDNVLLTELVPAGVDPHSYQPVPADIAAVADADVIFVNGVGLEPFLQALIDNAASQTAVVTVSQGVALLSQPNPRTIAEGEAQPTEKSDSRSGSTFDPHVWFNPLNVVVWTGNIVQSLSTLDPGRAGLYRVNGQAYIEALLELDGWIEAQVAQVPASRRVLVTDHEMLAYFADRYGFQVLGTIIPSTSTAAAASAQELAGLQQLMEQAGVTAVFVGRTVNPNVAERLAQDSGAKVVRLYTGSLGTAGGEAATYLDFMRYDVAQIVNALR